MTSGYSDRIAHALAFSAKYAPTPRGRGTGPGQTTHPANVAVILARHGCDETTIVAGILAVPSPWRSHLSAYVKPQYPGPCPHTR
jgi:(p)ppGpp synthase/HD superfamily hydrolase